VVSQVSFLRPGIPQTSTQLANSGMWPAHQHQKAIKSFEKLCPVHRSFIAMSGSSAQASGVWHTLD